MPSVVGRVGDRPCRSVEGVEFFGGLGGIPPDIKRILKPLLPVVRRGASANLYTSTLLHGQTFRVVADYVRFMTTEHTETRVRGTLKAARKMPLGFSLAYLHLLCADILNGAICG